MGRGHVHHHYDDNDDDEYIAKHPASASSTEDDVDDPFTFLLDSAEPPRQQQAVPLYAYPLLAASVIAVSSAATVFTSMAEVPPITLAAWRLQLTTVMQAPFGVVQLLRLPLNLRHKCMQSWLILAFAGVSMALHFAFWVWGLEHTSLVHALLLVSMSPVCIALGTWAMRQPISRGEQVGALLGLAGGGVLAQGAAEASAAAKEQSGDTSQPATVAGDVACAAACVSVIGYLYAGRHLRAWMPIFVYATIVTGIAAILLMITAVLAEGASVSAGGGDGLFGWVVDGHYAWRVVYLAIGPGIVGHTGFNTVLRYFSPLVVALAMTLEPLVGSFIGWLVLGGVHPGPWTYVGGAVMMTAMVLTTVAAHQREERVFMKRRASVALVQVFGGDGEEQQGGDDRRRHPRGH